MSRGPSGRIVVEMDPNLKQRLHATLALNGKTLKHWFLECVDEYLKDANQLPLRIDISSLDNT